MWRRPDAESLQLLNGVLCALEVMRMDLSRQVSLVLAFVTHRLPDPGAVRHRCDVHHELVTGQFVSHSAILRPTTRLISSQARLSSRIARRDIGFRNQQEPGWSSKTRALDRAGGTYPRGDSRPYPARSTARNFRGAAEMAKC
jgi:hypothetical protein